MSRQARMVSAWELVPGADLEQAYLSQVSLADLVPECGAIYLWRRLARAPRSALRSSEALFHWLDASMELPRATVRDQRLSHFAVLDGLTIRGSGMTSTKRKQFGDLMEDRKAREWLARYVLGVGRFSPPVYCGETADLSHRTGEHLSGETGFGQQVNQGELDATWADLELVFFSLEGIEQKDKKRAQELRQLLELVTTAYSVAGYVSRRG